MLSIVILDLKWTLFRHWRKNKGISRITNPSFLVGGPKGIRTPVTDVRGQCPRPLDDGTTFLMEFQMANEKFKIRSLNRKQIVIQKQLRSLSKLTHNHLKIKQ